MISTEEIAAALDDAGLSNLAVARTLGCGPERVRRVRVTAGVAPFRRGRRLRYESWDEAFAGRTVAVEGGHLDWTGPVSEHGTPVLRFGTETQTAYRYAFRVQHGREAEGKAGPVCGRGHCVAGGHLEDRVMREHRESRGLLAPPDGATWYRGVDVLAVGLVARGVYPLPELRTEIEQRYAVVVMTRRELSAAVIAGRLGIAERTVVRWRDEAGLSDGRR
ncbi:hypothetical protein ACGFR8_07615 [Streptomyces brevispora]|uniref:hypothetical protein n=1 Tax=Streptomyces brevispora TaxID=887462 RepID=UPI0037186C44